VRSAVSKYGGRGVLAFAASVLLALSFAAPTMAGSGGPAGTGSSAVAGVISSEPGASASAKKKCKKGSKKKACKKKPAKAPKWQGSGYKPGITCSLAGFMQKKYRAAGLMCLDLGLGITTLVVI
jgi:hypothetical protein